MRIEKLTKDQMLLTLPRIQRYLAFVNIVMGLLAMIVLYIFNGSQIELSKGSLPWVLILSLGSTGFICYVLLLEGPSIVYFFAIRNKVTGYGHILLLILNAIVYISTYLTIYALMYWITSGLYLILHKKTIIVDKNEKQLVYQERIFFYFTKMMIPFTEFDKIIVETQCGNGILNRIAQSKKFLVQLTLLEKDPGFITELITCEEESEIENFFRPQTLRKTLTSLPFLIDSSFLNFKGRDLLRINMICQKLVAMVGFKLIEEIKEGNKHIKIYRENEH